MLMSMVRSGDRGPIEFCDTLRSRLLPGEPGGEPMAILLESSLGVTLCGVNGWMLTMLPRACTLCGDITCMSPYPLKLLWLGDVNDETDTVCGWGELLVLIKPWFVLRMESAYGFSLSRRAGFGPDTGKLRFLHSALRSATL